MSNSRRYARRITRRDISKRRKEADRQFKEFLRAEQERIDNTVVLNDEEWTFLTGQPPEEDEAVR